MRFIEELTNEMLSLPSQSRAWLAEKLVESLEFDTTIQSAWLAEAQKRRDEVINGSVEPIPGEARQVDITQQKQK